MPQQKNHSAIPSSPGSKAPFAKKEDQLVRRVARGALLVVSFSALQYFNDDGFESKRLFDHRVVDNLQAPLTHYHD
ncbi:MAG: hypothetical protein ABI222_01275 [Opitutaceae bacterium]